MPNSGLGGVLRTAVSLIKSLALQGAPHPNTDAGKMLAERVKLLYSNLPASLSISVLLALILICVQAAVISAERLLDWSAAIAVVFGFRATLFIGWKRHAPEISLSDARRWLYRFRIGVFAAGIVWGIGGLLLAPPGEPELKMYTLFTLAGLGAGAATSLAIDRISVIGFLFLVLVPQIVVLASEGRTLSLGMSAMIALFLLFLMASARQLSLQLEENFHLRLKATENESRFRQMLESSPIATRITDADSNRVVFANCSYVELIGSTPEQVIGIDPSGYYAYPEIYAEVQKQISNGENVINKMVELHSPGEQAWIKWVLASYFPIEYRNKAAILGWFYDITDRKLKEDHVAHMAYHDTLTGLPNRSLFVDRLKLSLANAERELCMLALMFIDLDKFKPVNDLYGHHVGDLLLKAVAERIGDCLRKSDSVARIGGDEFVVLLPAIYMEECAMEVAEKIRHALNRPFEIEGATINISSSTGVAVYPNHAEEAQLLIKRADIAMYYAKGEGENRVRVYEPQMG